MIFLYRKGWGVPLTIAEFINLVKQYGYSLNKNKLFPSGTPTYDWLRSFLQRHKNLTLKKSINYEKLKEIIAGWLEFLASEKRYSAHTLKAYEKDLRYFLLFINQHLGAEVNLQTLADFSLRDFRSYISSRKMAARPPGHRSKKNWCQSLPVWPPGSTHSE